MCIALNYYAGGHFTRIAGLCGGVSQSAAWNAIHQVTTKLADLKEEYIQMPHYQQCVETAQRMQNRFHLPGFAWGVDGVIIRFDRAPRNIPAVNVQQDFWCRKMTHGFNCQVVGNDTGMILDIIADWAGSVHDARVWNSSEVKEAIEGQNHFLAAGDSGYPISVHLMTPYRAAEVAGDCSKRSFNRRLSGLRTVMTENKFSGVRKHCFPCLRFLKCHFTSVENSHPAEKDLPSPPLL